MFKVMIVDDEYYFRQALKISLPWEELGFRIAGEAKNGEEALARWDEIDPDIVLVDINMPIMDGIELLQNAKQREHAAKFIVLTGHSEFTYAKQAMQLGVFNYVLKPIDENELRSSLIDVKNLIYKERAIRLEIEQLKQQEQQYIPVLKDRFLNEWLQGGASDPSSIDERMRHLGIELNAPGYAVVVIDIDASEGPASEEERNIRKLAIRDIAQQFMQSCFPHASCYDPHDRLVLIIGCLDGSADKLHALLAAVRNAVRTTHNFSVTIGVGNVCRDFESISVSYKEAVVALKHRFVLGGNQVIPHAMIADSGMKRSLFSVEKRSSLLMYMRVGNGSETEEWLAAFFRDARAKNASMEMLLVAGLEIVSTCLEFLAEMSHSIDQVFQDAAQPDIMQLIQQMNTFSELESWIRSLVLRAMENVHGNKKKRAGKVVEEVKSYILNHYFNDELRIEDIARNVHLNYNHLCYVFKKETNMTINDYLTEVRMAKAKELFDRGEKVVQTIASQVGYADANYFGKCFKKYTGISPSKYVNNIG
ncbi:response regulator transcription factor [Paenibacillus kobensis]|uniref:response regulator transcription factor n=1 Tax=Paenibacillus kobensis TaxID=59841 RepID=UPI000FD6E0EF|nr:response regulator [Paenibacillus kobensis]